MARQEAPSDRSTRQIIDTVMRRRVPTGKYNEEQIDFVKQVAEKLMETKDTLTLKGLHQAVMDYGVLSLGFKEFLYEFYADAGSLVDIKAIAERLGLDLKEGEVPDFVEEDEEEEEIKEEVEEEEEDE